MECRETVVVSPIAFSFEAMHISDPTDNNNDTSPRRHSCPDKRSLSWNGCTSTDVIEQQPLIKVGSGEFGCIRKKIKKQRPSTQTRNIGFCVEQFISQRFTEEEAELTTLCLDLMGELARQQKTNVSPPRCPAPDPIAQTRPRKPKGLSLSARESTATSSHPFGLRPRPQKKKGARLLPTNFSSLTDDDEDDEDSDSSPPSSPTTEPHQEKEPKATPSSASLKRCHSMGNTNATIDIPTLDFAKLSVFRERGVTGKGPLLSPHPSPPRSPSSPTGISKPDGARYNRIEGSPRSAFVKPSTS